MNTSRRIILILLIITVISLAFFNYSFATTGNVTAGTVRIRKEPSTNAEIITNITKNTKVEILEQEGEWYKVKYNNKEGYIHSDYVEKLTEDTNNQQNKKITLEKDTDLHILPTLFSSVITSAEQNSEVEILKEMNNWSYIKYKDTEGWILTARLQDKNNEQDQPEEKPEETEEPNDNKMTIGYVNVDSAYVREDASKDAKVIDSLILNQKVQILDEKDGWYKITLQDGTGYISKSLVSESRITTSRGLITSRGLTASRGEGLILSVDQVKNNETEKPKEETVIKTAFVNGTVVNVRKEASTSADILTTVKKKQSVQVLGEKENWYKIKTSKGTGYIIKTYIVDSLKDIKATVSTTNKNKTSSKNEPIREAAISSGTGTDVATFAKTYLGSRYVYAGAGPNSFDCSGFTMYVYKKFGVKLPHNAATQARYGKKVSKSDLQKGDLLVFNNSSNTSIGHVGIYIGGNKFIHAANPSRGVVVDSLSSSYYKARFVKAQRLI